MLFCYQCYVKCCCLEYYSMACVDICLLTSYIFLYVYVNVNLILLLFMLRMFVLQFYDDILIILLHSLSLLFISLSLNSVYAEGSSIFFFRTSEYIFRSKIGSSECRPPAFRPQSVDPQSAIKECPVCGLSDPKSGAQSVDPQSVDPQSGDAHSVDPRVSVEWIVISKSGGQTSREDSQRFQANNLSTPCCLGSFAARVQLSYFIYMSYYNVEITFLFTKKTILSSPLLSTMIYCSIFRAPPRTLDEMYEFKIFLFFALSVT